MLTLLCLSVCTADPEAVLAARRRDLVDTFRTEMARVLDRAEAAGAASLAAEARASLEAVDTVPEDPLGRRPEQARIREVGRPDAERLIEQSLLKTRREFAAGLYRLARSSVTAGHPAAAFRMLEEVSRVDPDYGPARTKLGDQRVGDRWLTPFEALQDRRKNVWTDRFGWLPQAHIERYESGDRFYRGTWMPAAEEIPRRRAQGDPWKVETDHFVVASHHSLERAAALAGRLEDYFRFFRREYADLFDSPRMVGSLLESGPIATGRKFRIVDFANKDQYVRELVAKQPNVGISNGLYLSRDKTAYFFFRDDPNARPEETLYHEVAHQLLYEADKLTRTPGGTAHFWVVEGFPTYLESFEPGDDPIVGDIDHIRLVKARENALEDGLSEPFLRVMSYGQREFQRGDDIEQIAARYHQAAGLVHFFMHAEDGRYRPALMRYLREVYDVRTPRVTPLTKLVGLPPEEIDRRYREYLIEMDRRSKFPVRTRQ